MAEHRRYGGDSFMVWVVISVHEKMDPQIIENGTTYGRKVHEWISRLLCPHIYKSYCQDFIFMDENARAHRARVASEYLETTDIVRIDIPTTSITGP